MNAAIRTAIGMLAAITAASASSAAPPGRDTDWQKHIRPNAAYRRAQERPPFDMADPVGLVESESVKKAQRDAAEKLRRALGQARSTGAKRYAIAPGEYRFAGNAGLELRGYRDMVIDATGVTFWFERPPSQLAADPRGLALVDCQRLTIRGLKIDFDPPVFLQAEILAIDETKPEIILEVDRGFSNVEMGRGSYFLYRADGSWLQHGYLFHEGTKRIDGRRYRLLLRDGRVFRVHNRDPAVLELTRGRSRIGVGDWVVLPFRRGKGIYVYRCEGCVLEDVDEYASPGMGILERQGKGGNVYRRVRIIRKPGTRRLHVCAADGFHNAQTDRGPQLIECEMTGTSDDFFNLHGHFGVVWRKLGARRYVVGQANLGELSPGETLTFYEPETVASLGAARIARVEPLRDARLIKACNAETLQTHANRDYYEVTLDHDLPLVVGTLVALDRFRSAGFLIKDCYFHDAMARSLINGAGDGKIVGNVIERAAWGLVVHFETWQYYEGPMVRNLEISGNVFREIRDLLLPQHATAIAVTMVPKNGGYLRESRPLRNIRIVDNTIEEPGGFAIVLTNTRNATIAGNTIVRPMYRPAMAGGDVRTIQFHIGHPNYFGGKAKRAAISLWSSSDVKVRDNRIVDPDGHCAHGAVQTGDHCARVEVSGTRVEKRER